MKMICLLLSIIIISFNFVKGQCPPSTTCTTTWTTVEHDLGELMHENGFRATATFSYRINCEGEFEFIIEDIDIIDNSNYLDEFQYLHYSYSSITEKVALDYLLHMTAFGDDATLTGTTVKRVFVYTASCGIWLRCSYKLPSTIEKVCDTGWEGGDPHYELLNDDEPPTLEKWVDHWRWHSCGEVCCKKVYEIKYNSTYNLVEIVGKTKSRYNSEEECSKQGDFRGYRPVYAPNDVELPCEDGC